MLRPRFKMYKMGYEFQRYTLSRRRSALTMKFLFFVAFTLTLSLCVVHSFNLEKAAKRLEKLEMQLEGYEHQQLVAYAEMFSEINELKKYSEGEAKIRGRRTVCGRRVVDLTLKVCGELSKLQ